MIKDLTRVGEIGPKCWKTLNFQRGNEGHHSNDDDDDDCDDEEGNENVRKTHDNDDSDYIPFKYKRRSVDSYKEALRKKGNLKHYEGVKFDSIFNTLQGFHVCNPGLPPCLAYDIMEGVLMYDLPPMINHLISKGWITYELLNLKI